MCFMGSVAVDTHRRRVCTETAARLAGCCGTGVVFSFAVVVTDTELLTVAVYDNCSLCFLGGSCDFFFVLMSLSCDFGPGS